MCASFPLDDIEVDMLTRARPHSPTGSNPTGCSSPLDRKQKILALARKHDLLILEDDAYAFLHFEPEKQAASYFELEARDGGETGRVVRFDSMSKILSSGERERGATVAASQSADSTPRSCTHRHANRLHLGRERVALRRGPYHGQHEFATLVDNTSDRARAPEAMGPRRLPGAHEARRRLLSRQARHV